jgi:hypothetical protein
LCKYPIRRIPTRSLITRRPPRDDDYGPLRASNARSCYPHAAMEIDENRIDDAVLALLLLGLHAVLALLLLGLHGRQRAWKSSDWDVFDRLDAKDLISDPVGKAKWVMFTVGGLGGAHSRFREMAYQAGLSASAFRRTN